jgi:hypothetical protein
MTENGQDLHNCPSASTPEEISQKGNYFKFLVGSRICKMRNSNAEKQTSLQVGANQAGNPREENLLIPAPRTT